MSPQQEESVRVLQSALWPEKSLATFRRLRCRHCGRRNRVAVREAVFWPDRFRCGACKGDLFLPAPTPLTGLSSTSYQHNLDQQALAALESIPGLPRAMRWLLERLGDRTAHLVFMSEAVLCNEDQFPELTALVERARVRLDLPVRPTVYLGESPHLNALTTGVQDPVIVVRSALLDQMEDSELLAVLGHELGHLHANHPLYHSLARALVYAGERTWSGVRLLGWPLQQALLRWSRCAELTADRAALLAAGDLAACLEMMRILAGGNRPGTAGRTRLLLGPFVRQCRHFSRLERQSTMDRLLGEYMAIDRTHPHVARRVTEIVQWVEHGNYLDILAGHYAHRQRTGLPHASTTPAREVRPGARTTKGEPT